MSEQKRGHGLVAGTSILAGVTALVGAFLPWNFVYTCPHFGFEGCRAQGSGWDVLQIGGLFGVVGSQWNPSSSTASGVIVLAGAALLISCGVIGLSAKPAALRAWYAVAIAIGAVAVGIATVAAPVPHLNPALRGGLVDWSLVEWTGRGPGALVSIIGALLGVIGGLLSWSRRSTRVSDSTTEGPQPAPVP